MTDYETMKAPFRSIGGGYISYDPAEIRACLDGNFTVKQLRQIADVMDQLYNPRTLEWYLSKGVFTHEEAEWMVADDKAQYEGLEGPEMPASLRSPNRDSIAD